MPLYGCPFNGMLHPKISRFPAARLGEIGMLHVGLEVVVTQCAVWIKIQGLPAATKATVARREIPAAVPVIVLVPSAVEVRFAVKEPLELVVPDELSSTPLVAVNVAG